MTGLLGYEQEELIGRSADAVLGDGFLENARMHDLQVEGLVWNLETVLFRKDGREVPVILSGTRLRGTDDSDSGLVCVAKDIIERVRAEQQIRELAFYDVLTGLPNRRLMLDRIHSALKWAKQRDHLTALLFLDLDHFKNVNDTHGHVIGDEVLRRVAKVLSDSVRDRDCAARYGGEEFVVVVDAAELAKSRVVGERIRQAVENARMPDPLEKVTISVGVACTRPGRTDMAGKLLDLADQALYAAKASGRNCVRVMEE